MRAFLGPRIANPVFSGVFPDPFLDRLLNRNSHTRESCKPVFRVENIAYKSGLPNRGFRIESIANVGFQWKSFLMSFGMEFYYLLEASGAAFLIFLGLKTRLKTQRFSVI